MGTSPKTKADCDKKIAQLEQTLALRKSQLEYQKQAFRNGNLCSDASIVSTKAQIATIKGDIAAYKAKRRTLK